MAPAPPRDPELRKQIGRLRRELELLEDRGADISAASDASTVARASESATVRDFYERSWSTREVLGILQEERRLRGAPPRLVVTLPTEVRQTHRTGRMVESMMAEARQQLLVFGFVVGEAMAAMIKDALGRGVAVTLVIDEANNEGLHLGTHLNLRVYRPAEKGRLMHAKVVVADPATTAGRVLIGSANFSESGLGMDGPSSEDNWELGVQLGREFAGATWDVFSTLVNKRWLVPHHLSPRLSEVASLT